MKILFVRPPRFMWPLYSERSNFWQPLAFASIAAFLRKHINNVELKIIDCPTEKIGWKSIEARMKKEKPDVLCLGEETVSVHEAFRLAKMTKEFFPECIIVGGGVYFSFMVEDSLLNHQIDFIVRGEGEVTFYELVKELLKLKREQDFAKIKGISYKKEGKIVNNPDRGLIKNLDMLPMPAYDLLPMELYGKGSRYHTDFVAIEHSRGCISSCNFCILWKQMGINKNGAMSQCYRTKSVKKTVDEIEYLRDKFKRKTFCWVDPTWNADPKWNSDFADEIIRRGVDVDHYTWLRADFIVRDEEKGIFQKLVKAGLKQAMIGLERMDTEELAYLNKKGYSFETTKKAFEIIRKYPEVLSIATYIYGLPIETKESLRRFYSMLSEIPIDVCIPLPLAPNPGTKYFDELDEQGLLEIKDFSYFNFINMVARSKSLSRNRILWYVLLNELKVRTKREQFRKFMLDKRFRKRVAIGALAGMKAGFTFKYLGGIVSEAVFGKSINLSVRPRWYDG